jgi:hypothetical protein
MGAQPDEVRAFEVHGAEDSVEWMHGDLGWLVYEPPTPCKGASGNVPSYSSQCPLKSAPLCEEYTARFRYRTAARSRTSGDNRRAIVILHPLTLGVSGNPRASTDRARHTSVTSPAMISFFRPVASTAARTSGVTTHASRGSRAWSCMSNGRRQDQPSTCAAVRFHREAKQPRYVGASRCSFIIDNSIHNVYSCGDGTPERVRTR